MKITAINGSPHGKEGITNIMVSTFLKGAQEAGAEVVNVFLAEKELNHCKGCFTCWFGTPGKCVIKDDMEKMIAEGQGTDVLVLATPIKYSNISSLLKVFIERMVSLGNPYFHKDPVTGLTRHPKKTEAAEKESSFYRSKLVMIANGGLPDRGPNIQIISDWMKRLAFYNHTNIAGEIYAPQGILLANQNPDLKPVIDNYLVHLEKAGKEVVTAGSVSEDTNKVLAQSFLPVDAYIPVVNEYFGSLLSKVEHPYILG